MEKSSTIKMAMLTVLLITCTATFANASMFELEIVPVSKMLEDPTVYDSTMAYRKISVIGNLSEIGKQSAVLMEDGQSLQVDITKKEFFNGFDSGNQVMITGEFKHDPIGDDVLYPSYVMHYPIQDAGDVNISSINADPASYNGKFVTVIGELTGIEELMGRYTVNLADPSTGEHIKVYYYGVTDQEVGQIIEVSGLYNGEILHSEDMAKYRDPLSISTFVPGFTSITGMLSIGAVAILLSQRQRKH